MAKAEACITFGHSPCLSPFLSLTVVMSTWSLSKQRDAMHLISQRPTAAMSTYAKVEEAKHACIVSVDDCTSPRGSRVSSAVGSALRIFDGATQGSRRWGSDLRPGLSGERFTASTCGSARGGHVTQAEMRWTPPPPLQRISHRSKSRWVARSLEDSMFSPARILDTLDKVFQQTPC